jgi:hypothetical protein
MSIEYVPSARIWHKVSASLSGTPLKKLIRKSCASLRLFRKHRAWGAVALFLPLLPLRLAGSFGEAVRLSSLHEATERESRS